MKDKNNTVIYVGKAKELKNRVSQLFPGRIDHHLPKVYKMVQNVVDFDYIVTDSEFEALVLECSLIKLHNPKYNILLKDDKGYSYIKVTNEPFPAYCVAIRTTWTTAASTSGRICPRFVVNQTVDEANRVFLLPTCSRKFPAEFGKGRPCLNLPYEALHGGLPGEGHPGRVCRRSSPRRWNYIHNGGDQSPQELTRRMEECAEKLEFEKAAQLRDRIRAIQQDRRQTQKVIYSKGVENQDVIAALWRTDNNCGLLGAAQVPGRAAGGQAGLSAGRAGVTLAGAPASSIARYYTTPNRYSTAGVQLDGQVEDHGAAAPAAVLQ